MRSYCLGILQFFVLKKLKKKIGDLAAVPFPCQTKTGLYSHKNVPLTG